MGRNGCGKSTLLKILCGIYRADSGTLEVRAPVTPLLELGLGWNPDLDAVDNVLLMGTVMGMSLAEARGAVDEILAFAEVERFANLELKHYSSGMAARLARDPGDRRDLRGRRRRLPGALRGAPTGALRRGTHHAPREPRSAHDRALLPARAPARGRPLRARGDGGRGRRGLPRAGQDGA